MRALVVHGHNDQLLPLAAGEHLYKSLQRAEMIAIPDSSHQLFEEKPKQVAEAVIKFMTTV